MIERTSDRAARCSARAALAIALAVASPAVADDLPPGAAEPPKPTARIEDFAPPDEFVVVGGLKTHFVARGNSGPAIVFVHGFGSCTYSWRYNLDALAAKGFRTYAIDVKGFGLTAKPRDGQYHLAVFSQQLLDFLDAMKLERPILVGNSMGGAVIARLALLHPDRVAGVVLVDAAPPDMALKPREANKGGIATPPAPVLSFGSRFAPALAKALVTRGLVEHGLRVAYHDPKFVTDEEVAVQLRPMSIDGAAEALAALTSTPAGPIEPTPPLSRLKPPALIVWGRHDRIIPVAMADFFSRELPAARKVVFEKSGHMPHVEEAEGFNALLIEFAGAIAPNPK
jgi:pimeloyl-ACP methyl ester carboxylesterase